MKQKQVGKNIYEVKNEDDDYIYLYREDKGFKINIRLSKSPEDNADAMEALRDFYVRTSF